MPWQVLQRQEQAMQPLLQQLQLQDQETQQQSLLQHPLNNRLQLPLLQLHLEMLQLLLLQPLQLASMLVLLIQSQEGEGCLQEPSMAAPHLLQALHHPLRLVECHRLVSFVKFVD